MHNMINTLAEAFRAQHKQLYIVGGTVRDVLLHREESNDEDLATDATPDEIKRIVAPTHPTAIVLVGERFGTVRLHYSNYIIEITTFRSEQYNPNSRKPEVCFGTVLEDDLLRRDFTINAMACHPLTGQIIDPYGGRQGLDLLVELGLMEWIVPEVLALRGVSQQPQRAVHTKDVYAHVLRVVERSSPRLVCRWSALLHDIAKPRTRTVEDGKVHFFGHEDVGAYMARDILKRLHFDRDFLESVSKIVRLHMRANAYTSDWTDGAVRRLMLDSGNDLLDLLDLSRADITSYRADKVTRAAARVTELTERCQRLKEEAERVPLKSP